MAQQGEDLSVVHLQVDAVDGLEAVRVDFGQVLDLEELIVKFKPGHLGGHGFIVLLVEILKLEWIIDLITCAFFGKSAPSLDLLFAELIFLFNATFTAHRKAETASKSFTVCTWQDSV